MSIFSKLFGKKAEEESKTGGMEDFMTLIRVYFQAAIAADLGITNLAMLPDLRVFKTTLRVPTVNNKLGVGEKARCRKMLKEIYSMDDSFSRRLTKVCAVTAARFRMSRYISSSSRISLRTS